MINEGKLWEYFSMGNCRSLIDKFWKEFKFNEIFVVGGNKFQSKDQFEGAIDLVNKGYRNTEDHKMSEVETRKYLRETEQKQIAINYLKLFSKAFRYLPEWAVLEEESLEEEPLEEDKE